MTGEMADKLVVAIPNMTSLQQLWLKNNNLGTDKAITIIAQSLSAITTIIQLNLMGNQITEEAAVAIASMIHANDSLEKLYLSDNDLQEQALTRKKVLILKILYLENNIIPHSVFVELAKIFADMYFEMLDLSFNCLKLPGKFISQALSNVYTLTNLNLNNCFMKNECIDDLTAAILSNMGLKSLYLRANQLTSNEVISLCQSLKRLCTLK